MASGTADISPHVTRLDGGCLNDGGIPIMEDQNVDALGNSNNVPTGKPPRNLSVMRNCTSYALLTESESDIGSMGLKSPASETAEFVSVFRSGSCSEKGPKQYMEDEYICVDDLHEHLGQMENLPSPGAFYGVFDGHNGVDAASFIKKNILRFIVEDSHFPSGIRKAVRSAFVKADHAFADASSVDKSSGTTALTALILGR